MRLRCLLLGAALAAGGCVLPPAKVGGRIPLEPAAATPPSNVAFLVRPPAGRTVTNAGLVYAGDYDMTSVISELDAARELRKEAAAYGATAVANVRLSVGLPHGVC